jgi:hypothetical protein
MTIPYVTKRDVVRLSGMTLIQPRLVLLFRITSIRLRNTKSWMKCSSTATPTESFKFILITFVLVLVSAVNELIDAFNDL